jgi:hypothetical protein
MIQKGYYSPFHHFQVHVRVKAGAEGTPVEDAEDRDGVTVLNAAGKIPLTCDSDDDLGLLLHDDLPGQRTARSHGNRHMILFRQGHKVFDFTFAAGLAVLHIPRNSYDAFMILETVREKDQKLFRFDLPGLGQNQPVIDGHKGSPDCILADAKAFSNPYQQGKQDPDDHTPDAGVKKEIPPPDNRKKKGQGPAKHEKDNSPESNGKRQGKARVDIGQAHIGNPPEQKGQSHHDHAGDQQKEYKGPHPGPMPV